jgi:hypothetical protein
MTSRSAGHLYWLIIPKLHLIRDIGVNEDYLSLCEHLSRTAGIPPWNTTTSREHILFEYHFGSSSTYPRLCQAIVVWVSFSVPYMAIIYVKDY